MKKYKFLKALVMLSSIVLGSISNAEEVPRSSNFDTRIQSVSFNAEDVAKINTKLGYITTVVFSENETIDKAITGFDAGWKIESYGNKLFIMPIPVEQQTDFDEEESSGGLMKYQPIAAEWNTNLFVSTNKRNYNMVLNIASSGDKHAHMVSFAYHGEDLAKAAMKQSFDSSKKAQNCNYFVKAPAKSSLIVPDFAYDDGEMTYFGFSPAKQLPSIFLLQNKKEQMINYTIEQKGNYKVVAVHNLGKSFVLRSGDMAAGILNKSFGKYVKPYSSTITQSVERVDLGNT